MASLHQFLVVFCWISQSFADYYNPQYYDPYTKTPVYYRYNWEVKDYPSGNDYRHEETRNEDLTTGQYQVLLPGGRHQTVNYRVNKGSGFMADVSYQGDSNYFSFKQNYRDSDDSSADYYGSPPAHSEVPAYPQPEPFPQSNPYPQPKPYPQTEAYAKPEAYPQTYLKPIAYPQPEAYPQTYPKQEAYPQTYPKQEAYPQTYPKQEAYPQTYPKQEAYLQTYPKQEAYPQTYPKQEAYPQTYPKQGAYPQAETSADAAYYSPERAYNDQAYKSPQYIPTPAPVDQEPVTEKAQVTTESMNAKNDYTVPMYPLYRSDYYSARAKSGKPVDGQKSSGGYAIDEAGEAYIKPAAMYYVPERLGVGYDVDHRKGTMRRPAKSDYQAPERLTQL